MMKAALLLIVGTLFLTVAQVQADTPISVIVQPEQIFVMNGFDDNDNVELIVSGYLPTLCHQAPTLKQRVEGHDVLLTLTALYFDQSNPFCTQIPIPFLEVINLGMLEAGEYKVTVNRDTPYESSEFLHIAPAPTHEQNSFTYAQVEYIEKEIGTRNIILAGTNPSNCFELDRTVFMSNEKNAIAPNKRMLSSMTPTIVLQSGKPYLVVGTPGGTTIPTSVFQTIVNVLDFKMTALEAVNQPKFHHQWLPDLIMVEKDFNPATKVALEAMGYKLTMRGNIGRTELIMVNREKGVVSINAVGDKRGDDAAEGY